MCDCLRGKRILTLAPWNSCILILIMILKIKIKPLWLKIVNKMRRSWYDPTTIVIFGPRSAHNRAMYLKIPQPLELLQYIKKKFGIRVTLLKLLYNPQATLMTKGHDHLFAKCLIGWEMSGNSISFYTRQTKIEATMLYESEWESDMESHKFINECRLMITQSL